MEATTVHRDTLFREVWEEPISKLAIRYKISDVGLAKVCRKLRVPVPPRGYWARIQNGQSITRPKLPMLPPGVSEKATISPVSLRSPELPTAVEKQVAFEADPANRISVDPGRELHPLVRKTQAFLNGKSTPTNTQAPLSVKVGKASQDRAMTLLSTLLYAFEERGFTVEADSGRREGSRVVIHDEPLRFSLEEEMRRVAIRESKKSFSFGPRFELEPTNKLIFRIHDWHAHRYRKNWSDRPGRPLETQLNHLIPALVNLSLVTREIRLEHERKMAAIDEEFRQRELEQSRRGRLQADSRNWQVAVELRSLIAQVSNCATPEEMNAPELTRWLEWANWVATGSDPLRKGLKVFLEQYKF